MARKRRCAFPPFPSPLTLPPSVYVPFPVPRLFSSTSPSAVGVVGGARIRYGSLSDDDDGEDGFVVGPGQARPGRAGLHGEYRPTAPLGQMLETIVNRGRAGGWHC